MSNKKVRLTEADLNRIVRKVVNEARPPRPFRANRTAGQPQNAVTTGTTTATSNNPRVKALAAYLKQNKITPVEINAAVTMNKGAVRPQQGTRPTAPAPQKQGGNFISNAVDTVKQGIQKGVNAVQGLEQQGLNKLSQGLNSVANAVKPKQQGGVANAAKPQAQGTSPTPAKPQSQMTPEQLKAIQGQASRVPQGR